MSLRLRLALFSAGICVIVLVLVGLLAYGLHSRGHYDDLDRLLIANAEHAAADPMNFDHPLGGMEEPGVGLLQYNLAGKVDLSSANTEFYPALLPTSVIASPSGPAYDFIVGLVPSLTGPVPATGAFGISNSPDQRWRVFVLPVKENGVVTSYIESITPLGRLDASLQAFRLILLVAGVLGATTALVGARLLAGRALEPVSKMVQAARTISLSRDFSHRLETPQGKDELGELSQTFNQMLQSLEEAYIAQQRFVSDASHELRAPLTAIRGNLELLRRQSQLPEAEREEAIAEAEREAERLSRLVADLLILARADAGVEVRHSRVDLDEILLEAFKQIRKSKPDTDLTLPEFEPAQVEGDPDRLKQLLLILLDNALKYTPRGGQVRLCLKSLEGQAIITVSDNGVGIDEKDLPHIFDRFYRADPARGRDPGGTGLGLAIARWIVEQHRGSITLESVPVQGTTVVVALPLARISPLSANP